MYYRELKVPKNARIYSAEDLVTLLLEKCPFSKHSKYTF